MKAHLIKREFSTAAKSIQIMFAVVGALTFAIPEAQAGKIYFNIDQSDLHNLSGAGTGTAAQLFVPPGGSLGFGSFMERAHGIPTIADLFSTDGSPLNSQPFKFELSNQIGQGLSLRLTSISNPALLNYQSSVVFNSEPYNLLDFHSVTRNPGATVSFTNTSFTLSDNTIQIFGSPAAGGFLADGGGIFHPFDGYYSQSVEFSDTLAYFNDDGTHGDLSTVNWTYSADVTLTIPSNPAAYSTAEFGVFGGSGDYTPSSGSGSASSGSVAAVPETSTWVMGFLALGAVTLLIRKNKMAA